MRKSAQRLQDRALDRQFQRDGYVVVRALSDEQVAAALDVFERIDSGIDAGYYASIHSKDQTYKQRVDAALRDIVWSSCDEVLADHQCLIAAMMVKPPTGSTVVPLHQDWNTIDETHGGGLTCWMPLTPITELEGLMRVLPGSHRYMDGLRGSPGFPAPFQEISEQICDELMVDVHVGVGDVMVMDGRVLHTTGQNRSGRNRVAAYLNAIPADAQPVHYYRTEDGRVEGYEVDLDFFTSFNIGDKPWGRVFTEIDHYEVEPLTMDELLRRQRRSRRRFSLSRSS
jgi:ectoine hydroxylase-related dioxygenase (phytanoyl-CoA dioxygenase family)